MILKISSLFSLCRSITGESSCLEDGVRGSNEWVLGSQGCPLLSYGDPSHQDPLHHEEDGQDKDRGVKDDEVNDSDVQQGIINYY